jgi:hypothetical protein
MRNPLAQASDVPLEMPEPELGRIGQCAQRVVVSGTEPVFVQPVDFAEPALEPVAADRTLDAARKEDCDPAVSRAWLSGLVLVRRGRETEIEY